MNMYTTKTPLHLTVLSVLYSKDSVFLDIKCTSISLSDKAISNDDVLRCIGKTEQFNYNESGYKQQQKSN